MRATAGRQAAAWPGRGLAWPFGVSSLRAGFLKVTGLGWADLLSSAEKKRKDPFIIPPASPPGNGTQFRRVGKNRKPKVSDRTPHDPTMTAIATDEPPTEGAVREEESPPLPVSGNAEASPPEQGALPATVVSAPPAGNGSASAASSSSNAVLQDKMDEVSAATATASASAATVAAPPPAPVTQADSPGEEQPPPPQWDLRAVFARSQILAGHQACMTDGCDLVACSLWEARGEEPWLSCLDCQEADYGGWPPAAEMPTEVLSKEHRLAISERCSGQDGPEMPVLPTEPPGAAAAPGPVSSALAASGTVVIPGGSPPGRQTSSGKNSPVADTTESAEEGAQWDLRAVFARSQILAGHQACMTDGCDLIACSLWEARGEEPWLSCLDCQEADYGGWPPAAEMPTEVLSKEHRLAISERCSGQDGPEMPVLPTEPPGAAGTSPPKTKAVTPPPGTGLIGTATAAPHAPVAPSADASAPTAGTALPKPAAPKKGTITPSPVPPGNPPGKKKTVPPKQPSAAARAMHRKWQEAAERAGGKGAKVIVSKDLAKRAIFDMMRDSFRPMNINDIFQALKATVPSAILRACLDDMALAKLGNPFDGDSDEDGPSAPGKTDRGSLPDELAGSLCVKEGRNVNNVLYFVNQSRLRNGGGGLLPDERNDLVAGFSKAEAELSLARSGLRDDGAETRRLLSEPTNAEADGLLEASEAGTTELRDRVEEARQHQSSEQECAQTRKLVQGMADEWWKRRRLCLDFLDTMEDVTEGMVSAKKCLAGDGQFELESDEMAIKGALATRQARLKKVGVGMKRKGGSCGLRMGEGSEDFVGVRMNKSGKISRVYVDAQGKELAKEDGRRLLV